MHDARIIGEIIDDDADSVELLVFLIFLVFNELLLLIDTDSES